MDHRGKLYVVATSHLDTQWRWTFQDTIARHLKRTLEDNFALFRKFPNYRFSFEGAFRYMLAKEYYPELYGELKEWIARDRWHVCGSAIDAGDVNVVSPESLVRQTLYANQFFKREFGRTSCDIFLPDCFGFSWILPTIAHHCGLLGFSTSKLEWGSSVGIPFNIGVWRGIDGSGIVAAINPGQYPTPIKERLENDPKWIERINNTGQRSGAYVDYKYFGVGDTGGAPDEESVRLLEESIEAEGAIQVVSAGAGELFRTLTTEQREKLPEYNGEFLLIEHGVGGYTSMGVMKRLNRLNEFRAGEAELAAVVADWLGGAPYPREALTRAWIRVLANQMHDILPGTCIPEAYRFSVNDEVISLLEFGAILNDSVGATARALDTNTAGMPVVVYNALPFARRDIVKATVEFDGEAPAAVRVIAPGGNEVPSQVLGHHGNVVELLFLADVPSMGYAVFEVQSAASTKSRNTLMSSRNLLESELLRVEISDSGDIAAIFDKAISRQLLRERHTLQMLDHGPAEWPAWTIIYSDISAKPRDVKWSSPVIEVLEQGPVRASVRITREAEGSRVVQTVSLVAGSSIVHVDTEIDWATRGTLLKAAFPLNASNEKAVYDLGLGVIERGNNHERMHEVPAQQWAAIQDKSSDFGVAVLSDCKHGWDKPADNVLRLTLLHTPRMTGFHCYLGGAGWDDQFLDQAELDFGNHFMRYGIAGFTGDWRSVDVASKAAAFNQPLHAFQPPRHEGRLGREFSFVRSSTPQLKIKAIKQAEDSDEIIVRVFEGEGRPLPEADIRFAVPVLAAREVSGCEEHLGPAEVRDGALRVRLAPFQPKAFAVRLAAPDVKLTPPVSAPVALPYNIRAISTNDNRQDGDMGDGHSLPAELLPESFLSGGIEFTTGPCGYREFNAVACTGQEIELPHGEFNALFLLAAAVGTTEPIGAEFLIDGESVTFPVAPYDQPLGIWEERAPNGFYRTDSATFIPARFNAIPPAWVGSHRHSKAACADEVYVYCYLYKYRLPISASARRLKLPNDDRIRLFGLTAARTDNHSTRHAGELYAFSPSGVG